MSDSPDRDKTLPVIIPETVEPFTSPTRTEANLERVKALHAYANPAEIQRILDADHEIKMAQIRVLDAWTENTLATASKTKSDAKIADESANSKRIENLHQQRTTFGRTAGYYVVQIAGLFLILCGFFLLYRLIFVYESEESIKNIPLTILVIASGAALIRPEAIKDFATKIIESIKK